jgi:hypothetical protein
LKGDVLIPALRSELERMVASRGAEPDTDWQERGKKMLRMMGWNEGQGLGRNLDGITAPVSASLRCGKSGLGLAACLSEKAADRIASQICSKTDAEAALPEPLDPGPETGR